MDGPNVEREVTATAGAVGGLRHCIEELCHEAGATRRQIADVTLAVSEALTNVVMHAYVGRIEPGVMRISAALCGRRLLVEVEDDGIGIRPRIDSPGAGFGLALIATLAAEVEFGRNTGGDGALVRMKFPIG